MDTTYKLIAFKDGLFLETYVVSAEVMAAVRSNKLPEVVTPPVTKPTVVTEPPATAKPLTMLPPTWDGKQVFFHSEGGDGSPVLYRAIGITNPTAGPIPQTTPYPTDLRDKSQFYLTQSGKEYGPFPYDMRLVTGTTLPPTDLPPGKINDNRPPVFDNDTPVPTGPDLDLTDETPLDTFITNNSTSAQ